MKQSRSALILLAVQLFFVLSVAGKYLYERETCPRIWARATEIDPDQPLRGGYLALLLLIDACSLPQDQKHFVSSYKYPYERAQKGYWTWDVVLTATNGRLTPQLEDRPKDPDNVQRITLSADKPCNNVPVTADEEFFILDRAKDPFPLHSDQELWVEVTIPPSYPPRPIQLALSSKAGFQPLKLE